MCRRSLRLKRRHNACHNSSNCIHMERARVKKEPAIEATIQRLPQQWQLYSHPDLVSPCQGCADGRCLRHESRGSRIICTTQIAHVARFRGPLINWASVSEPTLVVRKRDFSIYLFLSIFTFACHTGTAIFFLR